MFRPIIVGFLLAGLLVMSAAGAGMQETAVPFLNMQNEVVGSGITPYGPDSPAEVSSMTVSNLTSAETEDLIAQQDAEMFQRDAYQVLSATYLDIPEFQSMADSADVLLTYGNRLFAGTGELNPGVYTRSDLRQLFSTYVGQTGPGISDGLNTAAMTEDMHIAGLMQVMARTNNPDLVDLYTLELTVARNNLRMIQKEMSFRGMVYTPQYLDDKTYADITGTPYEQVTLPDVSGIMQVSAAGIAAPSMAAFQEAASANPATTLSPSELQDVIFFQEMEKFDRDLYTALSASHPAIALFSTLASSAEKEMVADNTLLTKYNISFTQLDPGVFVNQNLQLQFNDMMTNATGLPTDALTVAAQSEDWHVAYLTTAIQRTNNPDVLFVYNEQLALSRNSLRETDQELRARGGTYAPQYITADYYNAIIGSPIEAR